MVDVVAASHAGLVIRPWVIGHKQAVASEPPLLPLKVSEGHDTAPRGVYPEYLAELQDLARISTR